MFTAENRFHDLAWVPYYMQFSTQLIATPNSHVVSGMGYKVKWHNFFLSDLCNFMKLNQPATNNSILKRIDMHCKLLSIIPLILMSHIMKTIGLKCSILQSISEINGPDHWKHFWTAEILPYRLVVQPCTTGSPISWDIHSSLYMCFSLYLFFVEAESRYSWRNSK